MRLQWIPAALGAAAVGAMVCDGLACNPTLSMYPPIEGCSLDAGSCGSPAGGGVVTTGTGGSVTATTGTGGVAVGELRGDVAEFTAPTFTQVSGTPISGAASLVFQPASGPQITVPYGASSGTTFDVMNVPAGVGWVFVQDQSGGANGIWPTITQLSVPQLSSIVVPVVSQQLFTNVASDLPSVQLSGVSTQAAQIVLILEFNGAPFSGVQVTNGAGGTIAYDVGPGTYSDSALTTGTGGTILLFNVAGSGMTTISVTNMTLAKSYSLPVFTVAGAVTVAGFNLE